MARGVGELRRFGVPATVDVAARWSPEAVAAVWASLACGAVVRPVREEALAAGRTPEGQMAPRWALDRRASLAGPRLPEVRSRLDPWVPTPMPGPDASGRAALVHRRPREERLGREGAGTLSWSALLARAEELAADLAEAGGDDPPIVLLGGGLDGLAEQVTLIASVLLGASVALEPESGAFTGALVRLRPQVVVAPPSLLREIPGALAPRRVRRWSRLAAVLVPRSPDGAAQEILPEASSGIPLLAGPWSLGEVDDRTERDIVPVD